MQHRAAACCHPCWVASQPPAKPQQQVALQRQAQQQLAEAWVALLCMV